MSKSESLHEGHEFFVHEVHRPRRVNHGHEGGNATAENAEEDAEGAERKNARTCGRFNCSPLRRTPVISSSFLWLGFDDFFFWYLTGGALVPD